MTLEEILDAHFEGQILRGNIKLYNEQGKISIQGWNEEALGRKMPSNEDLILLEDSAIGILKLREIRQNRRNEYPAIGDQLDALYKAMDAGILPKVDGFYEPIRQVKLKYPVTKS